MNDQPADSNPFKDKRRWWVALLLLFPTGIGYIYVGRPWRYVGFIAFILLGTLALYHGLWGWMSDPIVIMAFLAIVIIAFIGFAIDIVLIAIKQNKHDLRWPQRRKWYVASLALWLVIAFAPEVIGAKATQAARLFTIPALSMAPALEIGDRLVADTKIYASSDPRRGDVVIFGLPRNAQVNFVKRVIGLPGDKVQMVDGAVVINGVGVKRQRAQDYEDNKGKKIKQFTETLPNGRTYKTLDMSPNGMLDNTRVFQVPPGHYFVLGDNRDNSADSRMLGQVGYVPRKNIHAKATGIVYSQDWGRIGSRLK